MFSQLVQGDVLLIPYIGNNVLTTAESIEKVGDRLVIARGEKTGHAHTVDSNKANLLYDSFFNGTILVVSDDVEMIHDEHDPMPIPKGKYQVVRQRRYIPQRDPKNVLD